MKYLSLLSLVLVVMSLGCKQDFEELPYNIFGDESIQLFTFHGHTVTHVEGYTYDTEVTFSSIYSDLPEDKQNLIKGIKIFRNRAPNLEVGLTETKATMRTIYEACFQLAFIGQNGELSRPSEKYCFWP